MKAIVLTKYGSPDNLRLQEVAIPAPKDDEVLIKVRAAGINDWDWCLTNGSPFYVRLLCGLLSPRVTIPGVDIAGQVEAVGKNVKTFKQGDHVYGDISECGFGGFAEYVCATETALVLKPDNMTFVQAAAMPHAAMLALQGLRDQGRIRPGQSILINGAGGGVGTLGVQIANCKGVQGVTGVDHANKLDMMLAVGFETTIDYEQEDFTKNGKQYDLVFDTKTNRSVFSYLRALSPDGTYVTVGGNTARLFQVLFLGPIIHLFTRRRLVLVGLKPNKDLHYMNELFEAGKIKPVVDGPYKLADVPEAIAYFGAGKHQGKVVVTIESSSLGPQPAN